MNSSVKKPSSRSIKSAITVLKKAGIITLNAQVNMELTEVTCVAIIPIEYLRLKRKKSLKTKKVKPRIFDGVGGLSISNISSFA